MTRFTFIAVLFVCAACAAQTVHDSAYLHLKRLSNNAVQLIRNDFPVASFDSDAAFLYNNADQYIVGELTTLLANRNKVLAAHILLTKLLEPAYANLVFSTEDITDRILISYTYNGFKWKEVYDKINLTTEIIIDPAEIEKVKAYWTGKHKPLTVLPLQHRQAL